MGRHNLQLRPVQEPAWFARLFGRPQRDAAAAEVWNLVATTPVAAIQPERLARIVTERKVQLAQLRDDLRQLYTAVLYEACRDDELTDAELGDVQRLRHLLGLTDADVAEIAASVYKSRLAGASGSTWSSMRNPGTSTGACWRTCGSAAASSTRSSSIAATLAGGEGWLVELESASDRPLRSRFDRRRRPRCAGRPVRDGRGAALRPGAGRDGGRAPRCPQPRARLRVNRARQRQSPQETAVVTRCF
ncbi:MAG TPA: hypothetical protein VGD07_22580 [Methylomirabilota bacterium]|jgi:hypothetical protein